MTGQGRTLPRPNQYPPVDPRFRRRWAEARREEGRRRLRVLGGALVVAASMAAAAGLLHSAAFRVKDVVVVGNVHTTRVGVERAAGLLPSRRRMLMLDAGSPAAQRAVEALPWVATASFELDWPWTVVVRVSERVPVALVGVRDGWDVVDRSGRVLYEVGSARGRGPGLARDLPPGLPTVVGAQGALPGGQVTADRPVDSRQLGQMLVAAASSPGPLVRRGLQFGYLPGSGLVARFGPQKILVLLGDTADVSKKLTVLEELAAEVRLGAYSEVDLTVPQRPALTPAGN
jgi:hypothetical protein